ncbi:HAD family hydrolase [Sphingobacterium bovistauri]|uniref:HAD family phosphatase n=1 Tax=Sphingobacterium bovistauri TaxID=2781959 RepID=A0ABS7Z3U5_9SPHI|nr:HAD family phosphatase [Sphingobacterium bovistauri]MCA5004853.1 HAD family phosphatase [Sphingobacterium bovistauri]
MQKIENIILDYGNVIFMIDFAKSQRAFTQLGIANVDEIFAHSGQIQLFDNFDKGLISSVEFRDGIRDLTKNNTLTDDEIDKAWNSLLIGVPIGRHEILLQLKDKYRTFLLSNNNAIHYDYCMQHIQDKYGIKDNSMFFEQTYYSHLMGMRKPNADIFEYVLNKHILDPKKTLFIDDSPQHLRTAETLGIHTALCTKEEPLEFLVEKWNLI